MKKKKKNIYEFCLANNIYQNVNRSSYYFTLYGVKYRVSNHLPPKSKRHKDLVYIKAGGWRLMQIYTDLKYGHKLDGKGKRIVDKQNKDKKKSSKKDEG